MYKRNEITQEDIEKIREIDAFAKGFGFKPSGILIVNHNKNERMYNKEEE